LRGERSAKEGKVVDIGKVYREKRRRRTRNGETRVGRMTIDGMGEERRRGEERKGKEGSIFELFLC
jgi:hypothetical protein